MDEVNGIEMLRKIFVKKRDSITNHRKIKYALKQNIKKKRREARHEFMWTLG
jgi:hypothetical protein